MRILCTIGFKLNVIKDAEEDGSTAAERHFGHSWTKNVTCERRRQQEELQTEAFCIHIGKCPNIEVGGEQPDNRLQKQQNFCVYKNDHFWSRIWVCTSHSFLVPQICEDTWTKCSCLIWNNTMMPIKNETKILQFQKLLLCRSYVLQFVIPVTWMKFFKL
jgi:hypothetical protein